MPYIKQDKRQILDPLCYPENAGELNYVITTLILKYLNTHSQCYQKYNDVLGALEGAKLELYRRVISPYEDIKIKENGDVL